jgi:hypothetical protein
LVIPALVEGPQKRYIEAHSSFSYDRVLRVGPPGPALFYYPDGTGRVPKGGNGLGTFGKRRDRLGPANPIDLQLQEVRRPWK